MHFAQPHAPQCGDGLFPPEPPRALAGWFFAGHAPGHFGLGLPLRERKPQLVESPDDFLADWGEPVSIDGVDCGDGIFAQPYSLDPLSSAGLSASSPRVLMPWAAYPPRANDDPTEPVLELDDRREERDTLGRRLPFRYVVREVQPDGTGWVTLVLIEHPDQ